MIRILQMRNLRLQDKERLAQDHVPGQEQILNQPRVCLISQPVCCGQGWVCTHFADEETEAWSICRVPV